MTTRIRPAQEQDCEQIRRLYLHAFSEDEGPVVADMAITLLREENRHAGLSLVAEGADLAEDTAALIGHIAFSPVALVNLASHNAPACRAYILAPLAVHPNRQKQKIGSALVQEGIALLGQRGLDLLFVYGDPAYYGRFGFAAEPAACYLPPYPLTYPFGWQVMHLNGFPPAQSPQTLAFVPVLARAELW